MVSSLFAGMKVKRYEEGDVIVHQGDVGECMYVIASGKAEVLVQKGRQQVRLAILGPRDFFGEMAIFDRERRSATVRAMGEVQAIEINQKTFENMIRLMPWLGFRVIEKMSRRIRENDRELVRLTKVTKRPTRARKTKP